VLLGGARLGAVLDRDVVDLERDALVAGVGGVFARVEAAGEADRLALDEVVGGGLGLAFPDDQVDKERDSPAVAAFACNQMVATLLPLWVVRSWTSRVRRPLPVRVIMPWDLLGSGWLVAVGAQSCRRSGEVTTTHAPASPW
jgi:hypothetical protein